MLLSLCQKSLPLLFPPHVATEKHLCLQEVKLRELGYGWPLFTELPSSVGLSDTQGKKRAGAVRDPGPGSLGHLLGKLGAPFMLDGLSELAAMSQKKSE